MMSPCVANTSGIYRPSRKRTVSLLSTTSKLVFDRTKTPPAIHSETHKAYGAFTPTGSAFPSLRYFSEPTTTFFGFRRHRKPVQPVWRIDYDPVSQSSTATHSPVSSPPGTPPLPSISRTDIPSSPVSPPLLLSETAQTLVLLEKNSKFCARTFQCATCGRAGSDFPRCAKCGELWCSRECRLNGGKRHICTRT